MASSSSGRDGGNEQPLLDPVAYRTAMLYRRTNKDYDKEWNDALSVQENVKKIIGNYNTSGGINKHHYEDVDRMLKAFDNGWSHVNQSYRFFEEDKLLYAYLLHMQKTTVLDNEYANKAGEFARRLGYLIERLGYYFDIKDIAAKTFLDEIAKKAKQPVSSPHEEARKKGREYYFKIDEQFKGNSVPALTAANETVKLLGGIPDNEKNQGDHYYLAYAYYKWAAIRLKQYYDANNILPLLEDDAVRKNNKLLSGLLPLFLQDQSKLDELLKSPETLKQGMVDVGLKALLDASVMLNNSLLVYLNALGANKTDQFFDCYLQQVMTTFSDFIKELNQEFKLPVYKQLESVFAALFMILEQVRERSPNHPVVAEHKDMSSRYAQLQTKSMPAPSAAAPAGATAGASPSTGGLFSPPASTPGATSGSAPPSAPGAAAGK